jgi:hypothetical protein
MTQNVARHMYYLSYLVHEKAVVHIQATLTTERLIPVVDEV